MIGPEDTRCNDDASAATPLGTSLSRRALASMTMAAATAIVAACSGPSNRTARQANPTATSTVHLTPEPDLPNGAGDVTSTPVPSPGPTLGPTSTPTLEPTHVEPPALAESGAGEPVVRAGNARAALSVSEPREIYIPFAAVVSRKLQVREISFDQLQSVWNGRIDNWRELGDPVSSPVRRYSLPGAPLPVEPWGGDIEVQTVDELAERLWDDRGGVAIVPAWNVDHRMRALRIDGKDVLHDPGGQNPLLLRLFGVPEDIAPRTLLPTKQRAKIKFVGDIIFGRFVQKAIERHNDVTSPLKAIAPELRNADITVGNLECSLSDSFEQPERLDPRTFRFKTGESTVAGLQLADIDIVSRANNHAFDFGPVGMDDTSRVLDAAGIRHFGIGPNLSAARQPVIATVGRSSFAFLGYNGISDTWDGATDSTSGTSPLVESYVREDIERARSDGHIVIPYFHWGVEYVPWPSGRQRRFAQIAVEAGAAVVMGSHPHWVQAVETIAGVPVIYSLGNFVFDQAWSRETTEGMIADLWFDGDSVANIDLKPVLIVDEHQPQLMSEDPAYHVLERVWDASEALRRGE